MSDVESGNESIQRRKKVVITDDEEDFDENDAASTEQQQDVEVENSEQQQEEGGLDDLFGDDDDEEEQQIDSRPADDNGIVQDSDEDDFIRDDEGSQFKVQQEIKQRELRIDNLDIIRHPPKFQKDETSDKSSLIYNARIPKFLKVNPVRFDGRSYLQNLENSIKTLGQDELELSRLVDENTIRWRFTKESQGSSLKAESNSQIIEWEDGSLSLKLGDEIFDILQSDLIDTGLVTSQEDPTDPKAPTVYLTDGLIQKSLKLVPTSTNSAIHKSLASAIQSKQKTAKPGAQSVYVDTDPEKVARELEKEREDKIRERKRLQLKEDKERLGSSGSQVQSVPRYSQPSYDRRDEYEDDGFLVDEDEDDGAYDEIDEDEEEDDDLATERLKRIKDDGASKYKRSKDSEEDGEEEEDNDDEEREDTEETVRKKRRVIDDDEDDE